MAALLTYAEVAAHNSKKDLYVVIHDNVYNASSFVDEHPCVPPFPTFLRRTIDGAKSLTLQGRGGEEVLLDLAGMDATEAFEDVGHSDEAREILAGLKIGALKRQVSIPPPPIPLHIQGPRKKRYKGRVTD